MHSTFAYVCGRSHIIYRNNIIQIFSWNFFSCGLNAWLINREYMYFSFILVLSRWIYGTVWNHFIMKNCQIDSEQKSLSSFQWRKKIVLSPSSSLSSSIGAVRIYHRHIFCQSNIFCVPTSPWWTLTFAYCCVCVFGILLIIWQ